MKIIVILFFLLLSPFSLFSSENYQALDSLLECFGKLGFPSAVIIAKGNEIQFNNSYGVKPGTAFYVASVSKLFTASAIYKLEYEGRVNINDSMPMFFENVPDDKKSITIKHLLTHQAGLQSTSYDHIVENIFNRDDAVKAIMESKLIFTPGTDEEYSSDGYSLLAIIIEKVTGKSFEEYMRSEVFSKAGMNATGFVGDSTLWNEADVADMRYGLSDFKGSPHFLKRDWSSKGGAGMITTAMDLLAFTGSGMNVYDFYWSNMKTASGDEIIYSQGDDDAIGHNAIVIKYPAKDITVIILTNSGLISEVSFSTILAVKTDEALNGKLVVGKLFNAGELSVLPDDITGKYYSQAGDSVQILNVPNRSLVSGKGQILINSIATNYSTIYNDINFKAEQIINALKVNDSLQILNLITDQKSAKQLLGLWKSLLKKYGAPPVSINISGTSKVWWYPAAWAATWVEFVFEKETKLYRMEWDINKELKQLGGSLIKTPLTCIAGITKNGKVNAFDLGNNEMFTMEKNGEGMMIEGEGEIKFFKSR